VSILSIVRLLIDCGANVNEVDSTTKETPLHIIAGCHDIDHARPVVKLLLDANAHIDCGNIHGCQPEDFARTFEMKEFLHANRKLSLKCLCANLINLKNIRYASCLSSNLIGFVRMHSKKQIGAPYQSVRPAAILYSSVIGGTWTGYRPIIWGP
jgi:hypothetical protein